MKKLLLFFTIVITTHFAYSQKHSVGLSYGHVFNGKATFKRMDCGPSYQYQKGAQYNFNYKFQPSDDLTLITGLQFQQNMIQSSSVSCTGSLQTREIQVENLNIPFIVQLKFLKYFFVEGGSLLNFEIGSGGLDDQNGIGFSLGLGAQYDIGKFNVFIKSQNQIQTLIPFNWEGNHDRLLTNSLSFGVFYQL